MAAANDPSVVVSRYLFYKRNMGSSMNTLFLLKAFALFLVLEGFMPFAAPKAWRATLSKLLQLSDRHIQIIGCLSMLVGTVILFLLHHLFDDGV